MIRQVYFLYPRSLIRMNNYIGKSNFANYKNAHACLDDLKIYKRALDLSELVQDMNSIHGINNLESINFLITINYLSY